MPVIRPPTNPLTGKRIPPEDLQSSAMDLMGPGFAGHALGTIIGNTPAAEGLMNFVRRTWPSLGRAADKLPDIRLHYAEGRQLPVRPRGYEAENVRGGQYVPPEAAERDVLGVGRLDRPIEAPGGEIHLMQRGPGQSEAAGQSTESLIHELLHAIYRHQYGPDVEIPYSPAITNQAARRLMKGLSEERAGWYGFLGENPQRLRHGALDAMAKNIYRSRVTAPLDPIFE